jgi:hypothetical protein
MGFLMRHEINRWQRLWAPDPPPCWRKLRFRSASKRRGFDEVIPIEPELKLS